MRNILYVMIVVMTTFVSCKDSSRAKENSGLESNPTTGSKPTTVVMTVCGKVLPTRVPLILKNPAEAINGVKFELTDKNARPKVVVAYSRNATLNGKLPTLSTQLEVCIDGTYSGDRKSISVSGINDGGAKSD